MDSSKQNYNLLIAKKTEKIVTAIYLISQFLKDNENIKRDMRGEANQLLKYVNLIAYQKELNDIFVLYKNSLDSVSILVSYLTVARDANLISRMNTEIVIEGLRILENILIKKQFTLSNENLYINDEEELIAILKEKENVKINFNTSFDVLTERNKNINEEEIKNLKKEKVVAVGTTAPKGQLEESIKDIVEKVAPIKIAKKEEEKENKIKRNSVIKKPKNQDRKENRREQILSLFTKGTEVSINDISKKIIGCSVKTIQRELNSLLEEKKITRIGEKRWSKYTLA